MSLVINVIDVRLNIMDLLQGKVVELVNVVKLRKVDNVMTILDNVVANEASQVNNFYFQPDRCIRLINFQVVLVIDVRQVSGTTPQTVAQVAVVTPNTLSVLVVMPKQVNVNVYQVL